MAENEQRPPIRLSDWLILIFVLVVMGLLIAEISGNVKDIRDRDRQTNTVEPELPGGGKPAPTNPSWRSGVTWAPCNGRTSAG